MGSLKLPASGTVYLDTQIIVYSIETHVRYASALNDLWDAADAGKISLATSQLAILETLVRPLRHHIDLLKNEYDQLFAGEQLYALPIHEVILRQAAKLRAEHRSLRTPDSIHIATAEHVRAELFLTNDKGLRNIPNMNVQLLDDVI